MSSKRLIILSMLFLLLSLVFHIFLPEQNNKKSCKRSFDALQILPERLRAFIAARFWEKADHLMHKGPSVSGQFFAAGSYAGNTDIIPYLKSVIALCPEETAPYRLLASNYAYHLGMRSEALKLLEDAFYNCENSKYLHELYASAAFIHLFSQSKDSSNRKNDLEKSSIYIDKAIAKFVKTSDFPDPVFKLENYYVIKARIFWELEKPSVALEAWENSGNKLEESGDRLAELLFKYKQTGVFEPLKDLSDYSQKHNYSFISEEKAFEKHNHEHQREHSHDTNHETDSEHEKSLLQALIRLSLEAGFVFLIVILLYFHCSKSCGTVSCVFRFSAGK
ncbi:MAG: hypothetical protein IKP71_12135 [Candidatus Riflebacteria bacterium]|nr:hypothetical protein [Candidatus Riflebacteria bacterium]